MRSVNAVSMHGAWAFGPLKESRGGFAFLYRSGAGGRGRAGYEPPAPPRRPPPARPAKFGHEVWSRGLVTLPGRGGHVTAAFLKERPSLQGYLAHKNQRPSLGPPHGPRHEPAEGSCGSAVSYERNIRWLYG